MKNKETNLVNEMMVRMGLKDKALVNESTISIGEILSFMESNDPNGDYDIEFIREQPESVANILQQWVNDLNGEDTSKISLMKSYIEFLGGNDSQPITEDTVETHITQTARLLNDYDFYDIHERAVEYAIDNDDYFKLDDVEIELQNGWVIFELGGQTSTYTERGDMFTEPYSESNIVSVVVYELKVLDIDGDIIPMSDEEEKLIESIIQKKLID